MDSRTIAWSPANRGPLLKLSMSTSLWSRLPSRRYSARAPGAEPLGCVIARVVDCSGSSPIGPPLCPGSSPIGLVATQLAGAHIVDPSMKKRPRNPGRTSHFHKRRTALSEGAHRAVRRVRPRHVRAHTTAFPHSRGSSYGSAARRSRAHAASVVRQRLSVGSTAPMSEAHSSIDQPIAAAMRGAQSSIMSSIDISSTHAPSS